MNENTLYDLADLFKVFGDSTRLRILCVLSDRDEVCVADLAETLEMTQSAISHQLRTLKQSKLVKWSTIPSMTTMSALSLRRAESTLRRGNK